MKFLNKKEQVMDIQLTQYGKRLLSKGRFRPTYYAFFDDGILYDPQWAGIGEVQNDAQTRIIKNTPQLETQYVFEGIESKIKRENDYIRSERDWEIHAIQGGDLKALDQGEEFQSFEGKNYSLTSMLGTSQLTSDKMPAWKVGLISGKISGSTGVQNYVTCSNQMVNIPQIDLRPITYQSRVNKVPSWQLPNFDEEDLYGDETIVLLSRQTDILLEINEKNSDFENENFEIEIYEVKSEVNNNISSCGADQKIEKLIPLYFVGTRPAVENGILRDVEEDIFENPNLDLDPSYVEYFLDISIDNQISNEVICRHSLNEGEGIFSQRVVDCEEILRAERERLEDLYGTNTTLDDIKGCDV